MCEFWIHWFCPWRSLVSFAYPMIWSLYQEWFHDHMDNPYPEMVDISELSVRTGLTIVSWFHDLPICLLWWSISIPCSVWHFAYFLRFKSQTGSILHVRNWLDRSCSHIRKVKRSRTLIRLEVRATLLPAAKQARGKGKTVGLIRQGLKFSLKSGRKKKKQQP